MPLESSRLAIALLSRRRMLAPHKMKSLEQERVTQVVRDVIVTWNPYGLCQSSDVEHEFEGEIAAIVRQADRMTCPRESAYVVSRVFTSSFGDPERFNVRHCREVGAILYHALEQIRN